MRKAIVKIKLPSRLDFVSQLNEIELHFEPAYWQHDRIFVPKNYNRERNQPRISLRTVVKLDGERIYALVMRRHDSKTNLDVFHRTVVSDYTEAAHIVYSLGYELKAEVSRRREELALGDMAKIYIDKIDGVPGYYLKIERYLAEEETPEAALEDLTKTVKVLGIKKAEPINLTYGEIVESPVHDVEDILPANVAEAIRKHDEM